MATQLTLPRATSHGRSRRSWLVWLVAALVLWCTTSPLAALNGDTRYTIGAVRVTAAAGWSPLDAWTHRPLANRLLMWLFDRFQVGSFGFQEQCWFGLGTALSCGAAELLRRGLRRVDADASWPVALAVAAALAWAPGRAYWQPEWLAIIFAVAGLGVLLGRRGPGVLVLGGTLLALAALMKYTTVSTSLLALTVLACWGLGPAVAAGLATAVVGMALFALTLAVASDEWRWFTEMPDLAASSLPVLTGTGRTLLDVAMVAPVLIWLLPSWAAAMAQTPTHRRPLVALTPLGVLAVLATTAAQGQWYNYHVASLTVLAAGAGAAQATRMARAGGVRPPAAAALVAVLTLITALMDAASPEWRLRSVVGAAALMVTGTVLLTVLVIGPLRPAPQSNTVLRWTIPLALSGLIVPLLPSTPFSYQQTLSNFTRASELHRRDTNARDAAAVHQAVGTDTPLTYLAFGEQAYFVQNPSRCRYAAATFLQRSRWVDDTSLASFAENLRCLDDTQVPYVYVSETWFRIKKTAPQVGAALERNYDCSRAIRVEKNTILCPRR